MKKINYFICMSLVSLCFVKSNAAIFLVGVGVNSSSQQANTFFPNNANVTVGDTVRFVLLSTSVQHNVTGTSIPAGASLISSGTLVALGQTYNYHVTVAGTYNYHCTFHAGMTGTFNAAPALPSVATVPLCLVTVDSLSTHNVVVWEKTGITAVIDSFRIFREVATNLYSHIASVSNDSLSEYHDYAANPNTTSYRYKLEALDVNGDTSARSNFHSTIHLINLGNGNLIWTLYDIENSGNPVNFFIVYRDDFNTGNFLPISTTIPGTNTSFSDINYASYPNASYRVGVTWSVSCNPTRQISSTQSNVTNFNSVGISQTDLLNSNVSIYPNPFSSFTTIMFKELQKNSIIKIMNIVGEIVKCEITTGNNVVLDMTGFSEGIYFVRIQDEKNNVVNKKIVLQ